jgi:hypothetical protein
MKVASTRQGEFQKGKAFCFISMKREAQKYLRRYAPKEATSGRGQDVVIDKTAVATPDF